MRVLVADDDELMRALVEGVLVQRGHALAAAASDGESAWTAYEREHPPLVILDWQMPRADGLEVCRRIRAAAVPPGEEAFILVITARDGEEDLEQVLAAGADDYLSKPATPDHIRARVAIAERRIALARARREAEEQLARARWLAGIGETALALEHEINNPLSALLAHTGLLEMGGGTAAERAEHVAAVAAQARRIAEVVRELATLKDPRSVTYLKETRMIDLSAARATGRTRRER